MKKVDRPKESIATLVVTAGILILIIIAAMNPKVSYLTVCHLNNSLCTKYATK